MYKRYLFLMLVFGIGTRLLAQDPVFSQFYSSPLQLNPAFAGVAYSPFVAINYRSQYASFGNAFTTYSASYDQYLEGIKSGIGVSLMGDNAADFYSKNYINLHYSYRVDISSDIAAKIGISAGVIQSKLDWDKLIFYDQLDPVTGPFKTDGTVNPTAENRPAILAHTLFDISTGILIFGAGFHGGLGIQHLTAPNEGILNVNPGFIIGLPTRWTLHGGYEYVLEDARRDRMSSFISPMAMFTKQGDFKQLNIGAYAALGPLIGGGWFRHTFSGSDAAILLLGFRQDAFKVGYSYDLTVSSLAGKTGGTHEISLSLNLDPDVGKKVDINDCFKMFR